MQNLIKKWEFFWIFCSALLLSHCQSFQDNILKEKGIALGDTKKEVLDKMGTAQIQMRFQKQGHLVAIFQYNSLQMDYNPGWEYDDYSSPIHAKPGFQEKYQPEYRFIFIDDRLYSIEDLRYNQYWCLTGEESEIVEKILKEIP